MDTYWTIVTYILVGIFGLCIGSFLNVVIYRLPLKMSLCKPASHCPKCGYELKWYDNIPIFSYLFLGGKCRHCKERISPRYLIVEVTNMLLWLACCFLFFETNKVYFACSIIACSCLICVFCIDLEHSIIPDIFHIIILACGLVVMWFDEDASYVSHLIGGLGSFLFFLLLYYIFKKCLKKEAIGGGDIKLFGATGLLLGLGRQWVAILIASLAACIVLLIVKAVRKDKEGTEYPFGPFISIGTLIALLVGANIITWYLELFNI